MNKVIGSSIFVLLQLLLVGNMGVYAQTATPTPTGTPTVTATLTGTLTPSPTNSGTGTPTSTPTNTPTPANNSITTPAGAPKTGFGGN